MSARRCIVCRDREPTFCGLCLADMVKKAQALTKAKTVSEFWPAIIGAASLALAFGVVLGLLIAAILTEGVL